MTILCISQARMGSTRLPGKVLEEVRGEPLLAYHLRRLARAKLVDKLVLATSDLPQDDPIAALGAQLGVDCYRGSAEDVLSRFAVAVDAEDPDYVLRVTGDCPLIDPTLIDELCRTMLAADRAVDLMTVTPPRFPRGLDAELMSRSAFEAAHRLAERRYEREHVTAHIHRRPDRFHIRHLPSDADYSEERWVVDYPEDFELVKEMLLTFDAGNLSFGWRDCLDLLDRRPELRQINADRIATYAADVAADLAADRAGD